MDFSRAEVREEELERITDRLVGEGNRVPRADLLQRVAFERELVENLSAGRNPGFTETTSRDTRPRATRGFMSSQGDSGSPLSMSSSQRDLQRRFSREPAPRNSDMLPGFALVPPLRSLGTPRSPTMSPGASSGRPSRSGRSGRSGRPRPPERYRTSDNRPPNPTSFEDLEEDLDDANSQLRALLDYTNATIMSPISTSSNSHTTQHDFVEDGCRVKRRKLNSERAGSGSKGFRYGRFGQIEPGQLKMEIESCDGGIYADERINPPENILKNDDSVYCTKRNRCNIVLKHQGATNFTLQEIVISAPASGFSSP